MAPSVPTFDLKSANGVQNVECRAQVWNGITVRHLVNRARRMGKVWHDLSSPELTVAILLGHRGGTIETRHSVRRSLKQPRRRTAQIDVIPANTSVWGYAEDLQFTQSVRLYIPQERLSTLLADELDSSRFRTPALMHYDERVTQIATLLAQECRSGVFPNLYGEGLTLALAAALLGSERRVRKSGSGYGLTAGQLRRAIEFFEVHLSDEIQLQDAARELGCRSPHSREASERPPGFPLIGGIRKPVWNARSYSFWQGNLSL